MKKITVLMLALALAVPVQAWHLFPVRKKIVTVKETNYTAMAVACAITAVAVCAITGGVVYNLTLKRAKNKFETEWRQNEAVKVYRSFIWSFKNATSGCRLNIDASPYSCGIIPRNHDHHFYLFRKLEGESIYFDELDLRHALDELFVRGYIWTDGSGRKWLGGVKWEGSAHINLHPNSYITPTSQEVLNRMRQNRHSVHRRASSGDLL
jgi:hypothetical protein